MTYFEPTTQLPSTNLYTNMPDRWRDFNGFEVTFAKRMANRWSMNASYAYNNALDVLDSTASYEDPTCTATTLAGIDTASARRTDTRRSRPAAASATCSRTPSGC